MTSRRDSRTKRLLLALLFCLFLVLASVVTNFLSMFLEPLVVSNSTASDLSQQRGSVDLYIPGAGFSGFWYTLGRLQSFRDHYKQSHHPSTTEYYCFSAGCLALVTSLLDLSVHSTLELAHASRDKWIAGEISRYDVVEHFVDGLLFDIEKTYGSSNTYNKTMADKEENCTATPYEKYSECSSCQADTMQTALQRKAYNLQNLLPRINIATSVWSRDNFILPKIQKPLNVQHLKRLLLQTTWLPFITGPSFGKIDHDTGLHHNDGAFAGLLQNFIPQSESEVGLRPQKRCHSLLLPWSFDLLSNGLNMLLSTERAVHFWNEGLRRGVG